MGGGRGGTKRFFDLGLRYIEIYVFEGAQYESGTVLHFGHERGGGGSGRATYA